MFEADFFITGPLWLYLMVPLLNGRMIWSSASATTYRNTPQLTDVSMGKLGTTQQYHFRLSFYSQGYFINFVKLFAGFKV